MRINFVLKQVIIITLSLMACIDFLGVGVYIMSCVALFCMLLYTRLFYKCICTRYFLRFFLLCFISTFLYCFQTGSFNRTFIASILIMPLSMYIAGYCLIESHTDSKSFLVDMILIFAIVTTIYGFVTAMNKGDLSAYSAYSDEYINNLMRTSYNIWNHKAIAGTVLSPLFILIIAISAYTLLCLRGIRRIITTIFIALGIGGSLLLGSRANIVILLCCFLVVLLCIFLNLNRKQRMLKRIIILFFVVVLCVVLNIGGIQDRILNSTLFYRLSIMDSGNGSSLFSADGRWDIIRNYLNELINHPLGGISIESGHSAHNTILQYGAFGGFPGVFLALWFYIPFLVSIFRHSWRDRSECKLLFMPIVTSIVLLFMVESISISNSIAYSLFVMVLVMIRQHYIRGKYNDEYKTENY